MAPAARVGSDDRPPGCDAALAVADAVLYEGYLLYPYRLSAPKNQVRWQFGVLAPRPWVERRGPVRQSVAGSADAWRQRTECLVLAGPSTRLWARLRFLQPLRRSVQRWEAHGWVEVAELEVAGERMLSFDEAVPREFEVALDPGERTRTEWRSIAGGVEIEPLGETADGTPARVVRTRWPLSARVRLSVSVPTPADAPPGAATAAAGPAGALRRLRVEVENAVTEQPLDAPRNEVLRRSLVAAHCLLRVRGGEFLSLLDPPRWAAPAAADCVNLHTFPVLAGDDGRRDVVLSAPILMYDHPAVAPESPGDLFDACEIDEILTLRTRTLTDEEKREVRATDPRARAILERAERMPDEVLARLHGVVRARRDTSRQACSEAAEGADRT